MKKKKYVPHVFGYVEADRETIDKRICFYETYVGEELQVKIADHELVTNLVFMHDPEVCPVGFSREWINKYIIIPEKPGTFLFTTWEMGYEDSEVHCIIQVKRSKVPFWWKRK